MSIWSWLKNDESTAVGRLRWGLGGQGIFWDIYGTLYEIRCSGEYLLLNPMPTLKEQTTKRIKEDELLDFDIFDKPIACHVLNEYLRRVTEVWNKFLEVRDEGDKIGVSFVFPECFKTNPTEFYCAPITTKSIAGNTLPFLAINLSQLPIGSFR